MKRAVLMLGAAVAGLAGCGLIGYDLQTGAQDAGTQDDALVLATGDFSQPTPLALTVPTSNIDDPTLTADLREIYYEYNEDIYWATRARADEPFESPSLLAVVSSDLVDTNPEVSADGLTLYVTHGGGTGDSELHVSTRPNRDSPWPAPTLAVGLTGNGVTMNAEQTYAVTHNSGFLSAFTRANREEGWGPRFALTELNAQTASNAFLSPDGLQLYFEILPSAERVIAHSSRASIDESWSPPMVVTEIDAPGQSEGDPWLTPSLDRIVFWRETTEGIVFLEAVR